jgi:hypothetical protein
MSYEQISECYKFLLRQQDLISHVISSSELDFLFSFLIVVMTILISPMLQSKHYPITDQIL